MEDVLNTDVLNKDRVLARQLELRVVQGVTGRPTASIVSDERDLRFDDVRPRTYVWQLWPGRNWPSVAAEEAAFVAALRERAESEAQPRKRQTFERGDITAVCNALRCGLSADELFARAPGLKARRLVAAYEHVDTARARGVAAWDAIRDDRSLVSVVEWGSVAAVLMGHAFQLHLPSSHDLAEDVFAAAIDALAAKVAKAAETAADIEDRLARCEPPSAVGIELGRLLYDPVSPGVWGDPFFVPQRVGELTPLRLAGLLGERVV
jgi:hypothetical protein